MTTRHQCVHGQMSPLPTFPLSLNVCVLCAGVFVCLWCEESKVEGINWESEKDTMWCKWGKKRTKNGRSK